jgi:transcriptional regulator with XRE-family HTH domain
LRGCLGKESVARTKSDANAERDRRICLYRRNGFTLTEIAQMEGISRPRVSQIIAEAHSELPEEETRAEIASLLEFAERKAVELINDPGYVLGPNGRLATDEDGEPVPNKPLVNESLRTLVLVAEKRARLFGADKQQLRKMDTPTANEAMWAALASVRAQKEISDAERRELEELRRKLGSVTPGEVVRPAIES